jgi:hypothetical protein
MERPSLAYCGLDCGQCPAYLARQNDDDALRTKMASEWGSDEYPVSLSDINCDGCSSVDGLHFKWCGQCAVRACAVDRGVSTCATCDDYGCEKLEGFFKMAGDEARARLEALRSSDP